MIYACDAFPWRRKTACRLFFIVIPIDHNGHISPMASSYTHPRLCISGASIRVPADPPHGLLRPQWPPFPVLPPRSEAQPLFVLHASENGPFHSIPISSGRFCTGGFPHRRKSLLVAQSGQPVQLIVHLEAEGPVGRQALFGSLVHCHPPLLGLGEGRYCSPRDTFRQRSSCRISSLVSWPILRSNRDLSTVVVCSQSTRDILPVGMATSNCVDTGAYAERASLAPQ